MSKAPCNAPEVGPAPRFTRIYSAKEAAARIEAMLPAPCAGSPAP